MATTDRNAWLVFLTNLTFRQCFLDFYAVNFLCFGGNRLNIQGVSTDKATRKSVHNFLMNLQFLFLMRIELIYL